MPGTEQWESYFDAAGIIGALGAGRKPAQLAVALGHGVGEALRLAETPLQRRSAPKTGSQCARFSSGILQYRRSAEPQVKPPPNASSSNN